MKIITFQTIMTSNGYVQLFGLGEDNKMYRWDYTTAEWMLFVKKEKKEGSEFSEF